MEVLSILCYIISSPSAFTLIIFHMAQRKLLYVHIFFPQKGFTSWVQPLFLGSLAVFRYQQHSL